MMISQIEPFTKNVPRIDFAVQVKDSFISYEAALSKPAMVPPETPFPMRRQPTPILMGPLRWSVWSLVLQGLSNLVRRSRYSLGYERD